MGRVDMIYDGALNGACRASADARGRATALMPRDESVVRRGLQGEHMY